MTKRLGWEERESVCVREKEKECVCVCVRERERQRENMGVWLCVLYLDRQRTE